LGQSTAPVIGDAIFHPDCPNEAEGRQPLPVLWPNLLSKRPPGDLGKGAKFLWRQRLILVGCHGDMLPRYGVAFKGARFAPNRQTVPLPFTPTLGHLENIGSNWAFVPFQRTEGNGREEWAYYFRAPARWSARYESRSP
jgi:hypothetical protein